MRKAVLLGSGGVFPNASRAGPSYLIVSEDTILMFDCGRNATLQIGRAGVDPRKIEHIFLTHHHIDHITEFAYVIIYSWILGRNQRIRVYGPPGTKELTDLLLKGAYKMDIETRLFAVKGRTRGGSEADASDIEEGFVIAVGDLRVSAAKVCHWHRSMSVPWDVLAYRCDSPEGSVVISGDTRLPSEGLSALAKGADVLFHECFYTEEDRIRSEKEGRVSWHTSSAQLGMMAKEAGIKKVVLTHLEPMVDAGYAAKMVEEVKHWFAGDVIAGTDLLEVNLPV